MDEEEFEAFLVGFAEPEAVAAKATLWDAAVVALELPRLLFGAVHDTLQLAQQVVMQHANYNVQRGQFHEQAALEIETMTGENADG